MHESPKMRETSESGPNLTQGSPAAADWSIGRYEETADELLPAAEMVVQRAGISDGEHVIDLGCGTGNAALIAARYTSHVMGVDPAARLLDVARRRAADENLDIPFAQGSAESIPAGNASADAIISVFGVVFSGRPADAAAEVMRVLAPRGKFMFTAWLPSGTIFRLNVLAAELVRNAVGAAAPPPSFAWHHPETVRRLFAPHDVIVRSEEYSLASTAASPASYLEQGLKYHPLAVAANAVLTQHGEAEAARAQLLEMLTDANEDPTAFRATSSYVITTVQTN